MNAVSATSILVIGSDVHFCYLLQRYVRESKHPLLCADPDDGALELAQCEKPSLIVLEDGLPEQKSQRIVKAFKSDKITCKIPIILCSWRNDEIHEYEDLADVYLHMPILYGDFLILLQQFGLSEKCSDET